MYKVYQDPEGTQSLEQRNGNQDTNKSICSQNEETYRRKLEGLNEEIKVLNDKIEMVINNYCIVM